MTSQVDHITLRKVKDLPSDVGQSRAKIYQDIEDGVFIPPVKHGTSVFWPSNEVAACIEAKVAGLNKDEMRDFVSKLVSARITRDELYEKYISSRRTSPQDLPDKNSSAGGEHE